MPSLNSGLFEATSTNLCWNLPPLLRVPIWADRIHSSMLCSLIVSILAVLMSSLPRTLKCFAIR